MGKKYFSATDLKKNVSEVLSDVRFKGNVAVIKRYGKPIAKIVPLKESIKVDNKKTLDNFFGADPDFPNVKKDRFFREKKVRL